MKNIIVYMPQLKFTGSLWTFCVATDAKKIGKMLTSQFGATLKTFYACGDSKFDVDVNLVYTSPIRYVHTLFSLSEGGKHVTSACKPNRNCALDTWIENQLKSTRKAPSIGFTLTRDYALNVLSLVYTDDFIRMLCSLVHFILQFVYNMLCELSHCAIIK